MKRIVPLVLVSLLAASVLLAGCGSSMRLSAGGQSMLPAIKSGSSVVVDKSAYSGSVPGRGDIVAFKDSNGTVNVKRVVGLPGEKVEIKDKKVYINGSELQEEYLNEADSTDARDTSTWSVPDENVFVLGDNRTSSKDSRDFGCVAYSSIIGKVKQ